MIKGWVTATAFLAGAGALGAQVANELTDAARGVFRAFPHATSFRRIVRNVDQSARREVEGLLPFKVHFNELGPHALYVPFRELRPIGLLYVRTEDGGWGFSEISWSVDLDLRIVGFRFLRARSRHRDTLQESPFSRSLVGRGYEELKKLLDEDGKLVVKPGDLPKGSETLAMALVRSAMKTILVTRSVWGTEIEKLQDLALGLDSFHGAKNVAPLSIPPARLQSLKNLRSVRVVRVFGRARTDLGFAMQTVSSRSGTTVTLRWATSPEHKVLRVTPVDGVDDAKLRAACTELAGRELREPGPGVVADVARELLQILRSPDPSKGPK